MNIRDDTELASLVAKEETRQRDTLDLIASENLAPAAVRDLLGSVLTNKYSEGYPGRRYYPGNACVDQIEELAIRRARKAFKISSEWRVNVQPYSGSPANIAVYFALLDFACPPKLGERRRGDTLMGMELAAGGHLTHGHKVNFSGKAYRAVSYGVNPRTGLIDYDEVERLARKAEPKLIVSGLTAYPRTVDFKRFGRIAKSVGAYHMADISHIAGLVAAGLHPSPFPYADVVTTTTHKILRGPRGAVIFSRTDRLAKSDVKSQMPEVSIAEAIDKAVFPGLQGGPHDNVTAAIAYMFGQASAPKFRQYAKRVVENAAALAAALKKRGFIIVTGGTDNHLMLIDLKKQRIDGLQAEKLLEQAGVIANRNTIPGDKSPFRPSGVRIGTPAITTRGLTAKDMPRVAEWICRVLVKRERPERVVAEIKSFLARYPI